MNEEIWRPIEGYEGLYEVSSYGRVRSLDRYIKNGHSSYRLHKGKVISLLKGEYGYIQVNLYYNGKNYKKYVHRLVAQAFIPNPNNLPQVNHLDEDKTNNRVENLEWCDAKYNINYGSRKDKARETAIKNGYWTDLRSGLSKKEYNHIYYQDNKDKLREYNQKYYQENTDKLKEYNQKYYQENKDKLTDKSRIYYQENKDKVKDNVRSYYQKNKDRICEQKKEYRRKKKEYIQNNV